MRRGLARRRARLFGWLPGGLTSAIGSSGAPWLIWCLTGRQIDGEKADARFPCYAEKALRRRHAHCGHNARYCGAERCGRDFEPDRSRWKARIRPQITQVGFGSSATPASRVDPRCSAVRLGHIRRFRPAPTNRPWRAHVPDGPRGSAGQ